MKLSHFTAEQNLCILHGHIFVMRVELSLSICQVSSSIPYEPLREKTNTLGSDQVRHKPGCSITEDG